MARLLSQAVHLPNPELDFNPSSWPLGLGHNNEIFAAISAFYDQCPPEKLKLHALSLANITLITFRLRHASTLKSLHISHCRTEYCADALDFFSVIQGSHVQLNHLGCREFHISHSRGDEESRGGVTV